MAGLETHVCFTVGAAVPWEYAILFGIWLAEPPIVIDYLKKTGGSFLPTGPAEPERDWWDEGPLTERAKSYRSILAARKHGLTAAELDELGRGKMPDLLTYRGLSAAQLGPSVTRRGTRHEFYEIKPRSESGILKGLEKVTWLKKAYGAKGLPYLPGRLYPKHFYPPDGVAELPMLMMDERHKTDWLRARDIIKRRAKLSKAELTLEVRPAPTTAGLLLYRICAKLEYEGDDERDDSKVIHTARELVNGFVLSAVAGQPKEILKVVAAVGRALEPQLLERGGRRRDTFVPWQPAPVLFPMVDVTLDSGPQLLQPRMPALRDAMNTRKIGLPGERFMLCCDEAFFQSVIAPASVLQFIHYVRSTPARWGEYGRARSSVGILEAVQEASEIYDLAVALPKATFKPLVDWASKKPGEAVLIGVGVVVVSALAFWALPALAAELAALEGASLAVTSGAMSQTFIQTATLSGAVMEEATALELAAAAQLNLDAAVFAAADAATAAASVTAAVEAEAAVITAATTLPAAGGAVAMTEAMMLRQAGGVIGRRLVAQSLKATGQKLVGSGVGVTLMIASQTAFAAAPGARVRGGPTPTSEAFDQVIGTRTMRMFILRPDAQPRVPWPGPDTPPEKRKPTMGELIDAAKFSTEAAAALKSEGQTKLECRYVGELLVK